MSLTGKIFINTRRRSYEIVIVQLHLYNDAILIIIIGLNSKSVVHRLTLFHLCSEHFENTYNKRIIHSYINQNRVYNSVLLNEAPQKLLQNSICTLYKRFMDCLMKLFEACLQWFPQDCSMRFSST